MKVTQKALFLGATLFTVSTVWAGAPASPYYGTGLCNNPQFECIKVKRGDTWQRLFPDEKDRDIVQKVNRTYNYLWAGKVIAIPKNLKEITILDVSPFPAKMEVKEKQIIVDQDKLAWGAYNQEGNLIYWGPISSGVDKCPDSRRSCRTMTGIFRMFSKEDSRCRSDVYPVGRGGARMPYCMYFHKGFAMHGSDDIPGRRASHGCVRMFTRDAKWLNHEFVDISDKDNQQRGTKVIVRPVDSVGRVS